METHDLPAGTSMYFGVPETPMPDVIVEALRQAMEQVPGVVEAYLPMLAIPGTGHYGQALFLAIAPTRAVEDVMPTVVQFVGMVMPTGEPLDIFPYPADRFPPGARVAECALITVEARKRPWWKLW